MGKRKYFTVFIAVVGLCTFLELFVVYTQATDHLKPLDSLYSVTTRPVFNTLRNSRRSEFNLSHISCSLTEPYEGKARTLDSAVIREPSVETVKKVSRSSVTASINPFLGFVEINEQLSSNTAKFMQLSYFSALWNFSMVEPWIDADTTFLSSFPPANNGQTLLFFDLYNMTAVENRLTKCFNDNLPPQRQKNFHFHSLSEALIHSPRDVLIVRFMTKKWSKTEEMGDCSAISERQIEKVNQTLNFNVQKVKEKAQEVHGPSFSFKIWKTLCIAAIRWVPFSMHNASVFIEEQLAEKKKETSIGATVILPSWNKIKNMHSHSYYYDPDFHLVGRDCSFSRLPHSHLVLTGAERMQKELQFSQHFIGVYARTERMSHLDDGLINDCWNRFCEVLEHAEKVYGIPRSRVVLVHDAGKYGSNTFDENERTKSDKILARLQSLNIQTKYYNPKLHKDLPQHRVFIALVEQEFLSQSLYLITLGGGGFQINVMNHFRIKETANRAHALCV